MDSTVRKYLAVKSSWRGSYSRIFNLGNNVFQTLDPKTMNVTNAWEYKQILDIAASPDEKEVFILTVPKEGGLFSAAQEDMKFSCQHRTALLTELHRLRCNATNNMGRGMPTPIAATKVTRTDQGRNCNLTIAPQGILVHADNASGKLLSEYLYKDIVGLQKVKDDPTGVLVYVTGRARTLMLENRDDFIAKVIAAGEELGTAVKLFEDPVTLLTARAARARYGTGHGLPALAEFKVAKLTKKHEMPISRLIVINEETFSELDADNYGVVSARPLGEVFALVQSWDEAQRLGVEYKDGMTRWYLTGERNALLAALLDACHGAGNMNVSVNADVSGGPSSLRVIPRNAVAEVSLEQQILGRIPGAAAAQSKAATGDESGSTGPPAYNAALVGVITELNANVSIEGIAFSTKKYLVIDAIKHVVTELHTLSKQKMEVPASVSINLLQCLKRLFSTQEGYRGWAKVGPKETDWATFSANMQTALQSALCSANSGVVYWTLEVLGALCCPNRVRNKEAEMENKLALLRGRTLELAIGLLDNRQGQVESAPMVAMALLRIFESTLCSSRDTTHKDISEPLLQMVAARHVSMLGLLRSKCSGVAESVSLLMWAIIQESPPAVVDLVKNAALQEGVVLKYFSKAIFAPTMEQRFVARYLCSLWMSNQHAPSMDLLRRVVPPGLRHFLQTKNLSDHAVESLESDEKNNTSANSKPSARLQALRETIEKLGSRPVHVHAKGENFTSFFLMASRDHTLPDLIWDQQTRAELRDALSSELRDFLRERELAGKARISWNHSEFEVYYPSLDNEIQIGDHYVRLLFDSSGLGAGAVQELRNPANFFECLYRRFLRESRASLKALCLRAMALVHLHHASHIQPFEDIAYLLQVLATTRHAAIRDRALLLLRELVKNPANAKLILRGHVARGAGFHADAAFRMLIQLMCMAHTQEAKRSANLMQASLLLTSGDAPGETSAPAPGPSDADARAKWDAESKVRASEMAKEVLAAKEWKYRLRKQKKSDPEPDSVTVNGLKSLLEEGVIDEDTFVYATGMRTWQPLKKVPQLRWQLLAETGDDNMLEREEDFEFFSSEVDAEDGDNKARSSSTGSAPKSPVMGASTFEVAGEGERVLSPKQIGVTALEILETLVVLHPAVDSTEAAVVPPPRAKRVLSDRTEMPLTHVAQTCLTAEPEIVDVACRLLLKVCEHNPRACSKLYLTGVYYMLMGYAGSNFLEISKLLHSTHMLQHFRSEGRETLLREGSLKQNSILGTMLPECMLCILQNYGPERFAEVFLGNFDTPEVIWTYDMRQRLIKATDQHLATLRGRLVQNIATRYDLEFAPIPTVNFPELEEELWCQNYYLRNLTDERRFPNWPVSDPVGLLKASLDSWRRERDKGKGDQATKVMGEDEALEVLKLRSRAENTPAEVWDNAVRSAYRKLARKYHPDRNPQGRAIFEKIQKAYELLSSARPSSFAAPDPINIHLLIRTQCILFQRFAKELAPYKYAGYPMVMDALTTGPMQSLTKNTNIIIHSSQLVYLTCLCCSLNARELVRVNGVEKMGTLLIECMSTVTANTEPKHSNISISKNLLHTMAGLSSFPQARQRISMSRPIIDEICRTLALAQAPKVIHYSLETIARLSVDYSLQAQLMQCGFMLYAVPLLLPYDSALGAKDKRDSTIGKDVFKEKDAPETKGEAQMQQAQGGKGDNVQELANHSAKLAARALSRMGGYLGGSLKSPPNHVLRSTMDALLTPVLANKLKRKAPAELLKILSDNTESATIIWNATMRKRLMAFVLDVLGQIRSGRGIELREMGALFEYEELASELYVGGVYVRVYNDHPDTLLEGASDVANAMFDYMGSEFFEVSKRTQGVVKPNAWTPKLVAAEPTKKAGEEESAEGASGIEAEFREILMKETGEINTLLGERGELRGRGAHVMGKGKQNSLRRVLMCLQAILNIVASHDVYESLASNIRGLELIFTYVEEDEEVDTKFAYSADPEIVELRRLALSVIKVLSGNKGVADGIASMKLVGTLLHVI